MLPTPPVSWGGVVLLLGTVSAVWACLFALGQHDLKRLLAYHSVENIGIILMGLGVAMIGQSRGSPHWIVLGMAGCLLHVWNHGLFKSLLFLAAGSVIHGTAPARSTCMGGTGRRMPTTASLFFIGAVAICGLPPLNGFVSELLIYLGLFHSVGHLVGLGIGGCSTGIGGGAGAGMFRQGVRIGLSRPAAIATHRLHARIPGHDGRADDRPGIVLCGHRTVSVARDPAAGAVIGQWHPELAHAPVLGELVPLAALTPMALLAGFLVVVYIWGRSRQVATSQRGVGTWDCGFAQPDEPHAYTASSFAAGLVDLFGGVLRPASHEPVISGEFPAASEYHSRVGDVVLERVLWRWWAWFQSRVAAGGYYSKVACRRMSCTF